MADLRDIIAENLHAKLMAARVETDENPTDGQKEAGNYRKGHVSIHGFNITIENPKGSYRKGKDRNGKEWKTLMHNDYGYFVRTLGKDGDAIDVFIGPNLDSKKIFPVDQYVDGKFDETKVMLGFDTAEQAKAAYLSNYEKDWKGFKYITEVDIDTFKKWLYDGAKQRKPFAKYKTLNEDFFDDLEYNQPSFEDFEYADPDAISFFDGEKRVTIGWREQNAVPFAFVDGKYIPGKGGQAHKQITDPIVNETGTKLIGYGNYHAGRIYLNKFLTIWGAEYIEQPLGQKECKTVLDLGKQNGVDFSQYILLIGLFGRVFACRAEDYAKSGKYALVPVAEFLHPQNARNPKIDRFKNDNDPNDDEYKRRMRRNAWYGIVAEDKLKKTIQETIKEFLSKR